MARAEKQSIENRKSKPLSKNTYRFTTNENVGHDFQYAMNDFFLIISFDIGQINFKTPGNE